MRFQKSPVSLVASLALTLTLTTDKTASGSYAPSGDDPPTLHPHHPEPFDVALSRVEFFAHEADVELRSYDQDGTVVGVVVLSYGESGDLRIMQEYDDGWTETIITADGEVLTEGTLDPEPLEHRAQLVEDVLQAEFPDLGPQAKNSWWKCARWLATAAIGCAAARPIACVGGAIQVGCTYAPMIQKDYRKYECPWNA